MSVRDQLDRVWRGSWPSQQRITVELDDGTTHSGVLDGCTERSVFIEGRPLGLVEGTPWRRVVAVKEVA